MRSLEQYLDQQLARGRSWFTRDEALKTLDDTPQSFRAAASRLAKKQRLARPKRGFYLILRPEDQITGAPDPARWIDPLMSYLRLDYRISLLRAAAFHGSSHQAAMVFQVIAPKQIPAIGIGRHRIAFIYQSPAAFAKANEPAFLERLKTESGYAKVAGIELTLLDCARYYHKAAGINGVAQIVHDLGARARPAKLANAAGAYENAAVRRLGYLLDHFGYEKQAAVLLPFAQRAKSFKNIDPAVREIAPLRSAPPPKDFKWKLLLNEIVEIDT